MKTILAWFSISVVASAAVLYASYPVYEPWLGDADADGLPDLAETWVYGTDPENPDSDGDLLPDRFEIDGELDPLVASDIGDDPDGDGLDNLSEVINATDPAVADTDGDGVDDGVEAGQGSYPLDPSDFLPPDPAEIITLTLSVGDPSSSHSERYNLVVGPFRHQAPEFGRMSTRDYTFRKGHTHPMSLKHAGTKPGFGLPDFDWSAGIATASAPAGYFYIDDSNQPIMGGHNFDQREGFGFPGAGSIAQLYVPLLDIDGDADADGRVDENDSGTDPQEIVVEFYEVSGHEPSTSVSLRSVMPVDLPPGEVYLSKEGSGAATVTLSDPPFRLWPWGSDDDVFLQAAEDRSEDLWETLSRENLDLRVHMPAPVGDTSIVVLRLTYARDGNAISEASLRLVFTPIEFRVRSVEIVRPDDTSEEIDEVGLGETFVVRVTLEEPPPASAGSPAIPVTLESSDGGDVVTVRADVKTSDPAVYLTKPIPVVDVPEQASPPSPPRTGRVES